ncbi:unnamed protein product, partial [marine sediment metagenome]
MATMQQLEDGVKAAYNSGNMEYARILGAKLVEARKDVSLQINLDAIVPGTEPTEPEPTLGEQAVGAGEAALAIGTGATGGAVGMAGGFLKGVVDQLRSGKFGTREAADLIEQEAMKGAQALTYEPRTETGQEYAKEAGEVLQEVVPPVLPIVGAPGALAAPASAAARMARPVVAAAEAVPEVVSGVFKYQSPTKQRIAKLIQEGSTDAETAKFKIDESPGVAKKEGVTRSKLGELLNIDGARVKTDKRAVEAIRQGFDDGVIAAVKGASAADRTKMKRMVNIME